MISSYQVAILLTIYTVLSYGAITIHMIMVKEFGGVVTVLVGNTRKALTILLSFLLFPKPGSMLYLCGTILVFGGLTGQAYYKETNREGKKAPAEFSQSGNPPGGNSSGQASEVSSRRSV